MVHYVSKQLNVVVLLLLILSSLKDITETIETDNQATVCRNYVKIDPCGTQLLCKLSTTQHGLI